MTTHRDSAATELARCVVLLCLEGASLGLATWAATASFKLSNHVLANGLPPGERLEPLHYCLAGAGLGTLIGLTFLLFGAKAVILLYRVPRRLAPTLVFWVLPVLWDYRLWQGREMGFLLAATLATAAFQGLLKVACKTPPIVARTLETSRWHAVLSWAAESRKLPGVCMLAAVAGYVGFFSFHTIRTHYRLGTASFDMAVEHNLVWNAAHWGPLFKTSPLGGPTATHLGFHQTYITYLLAIPYRIAPGPEILLVFQAMAMGGAAIPLYFIAARKLGRWTGCFVAVLYILYPPLHGAGLYDFHHLPFATVFLWLTVYFVQTRRPFWSVVAVLLALSVREDVPALLVIVGAFLTMTGERPLSGIVVSAVGAAFFVLLKMIIMPRFLSGGEAYVHQYAVLIAPGEAGFGGVLKTVIGNPAFTMDTLLERDKLLYFLKIGAPLAFFPWRRPIGFLCAVPGFFFTLLATKYPPLIQISFQYTTYWSAFLFLAVVANLSWLGTTEPSRPGATRHATRAAWLGALAMGTLLMTRQFGAFLQQDNVMGGFGRYRFDLTSADVQRHDRLYSLIAMVPPNAKIVSSEMVTPQVSSRPDSYTLRTGLYDAEYLIIWLPPTGYEVAPAVEAIKGGVFGVMEVRGEFLLARRGHSTEKNAAIVAQYHW